MKSKRCRDVLGADQSIPILPLQMRGGWHGLPSLNGVRRRTTIRNNIGHLVLAWSIGTATFATCRARSIPALEFPGAVGGFDGTFETDSVSVGASGVAIPYTLPSVSRPARMLASSAFIKAAARPFQLPPCLSRCVINPEPLHVLRVALWDRYIRQTPIYRHPSLQPIHADLFCKQYYFAEYIFRVFANRL